MERIWKFFEPPVLASASPRRKELLNRVCEKFEIVVPKTDEDVFKGLPPKKLVLETSKAKCLAAMEIDTCRDKTVISADTVVYRKKLYSKPSDLINAVEMLTELSGKWHCVYTGVTVAVKGQIESNFCVISPVKLKLMSAEEIKKYVYEKKPLDKAGAYAIQEGVMVQSYFNSYTNIVGLPMERLYKELKKIGVIYG